MGSQTSFMMELVRNGWILGIFEGKANTYWWISCEVLCIKNEEIYEVWLGIFEISVEHQVEYQEVIWCINEFQGGVWAEDGKCT